MSDYLIGLIGSGMAGFLLGMLFGKELTLYLQRKGVDVR